jgi:peptidoglycan/xylan/chitin deacetylase (PgdA/CDA1 family)
LVGKPKTRDYYVSPKILDEQMNYLAEKGYKTLTPKEFYDILKTGKNPKQKSVMLTFDDGNYNNYSNAFPILEKYGFTGVFYVPSARRGINNAQLREMVAGGMVIDPHGKTHMLLSKIFDMGVLYDELVNSKNSIESVTGQTSYSFCYPGCEYNSSVTSILGSNNYSIAFSCGASIDHRLSNRFSLSRNHVYNDMQHFKSILSGVQKYPTSYAD